MKSENPSTEPSRSPSTDRDPDVPSLAADSLAADSLAGDSSIGHSSVGRSSTRSTGWPEKVQLVLRPVDQPTIAAAVLLSLILVGVYVWQQSMLRNGLMDIDHADERIVEYQIDINQAKWTEIANLPGIGKGTADAVVRFRSEHGPFQSVEGLSRVPGIGPKKLEAIRTHLLPIPSEPERRATFIE